MSNNVGESVGNAVKGVFNTVGGAGEAIRGNINSALDGAGDAIAGRTDLGTNEPSSLTKEDNSDVAAKGKQQFKDGIAQVRGGTSA